MIKNLLKSVALLAAMCTVSVSANAQFGKVKVGKVADAAKKGVQAMTLTDEQMAAYAQEYMEWMDEHNPVCSVNDSDAGMKSFAERLEKIKENIPFKGVDGIPLDIKAYYVVDVNAFSCPNGSIRVFAGLMELMTDDEILAVIGHEIGHLVNKDSKDGFKKALLTSALKDAVASTSDKAEKLSDSQLGALGEALTNAQFSQKQESEADVYGYEFMKKCGKDPANMAKALAVLHKLEQESGASNNKLTQLFSSHPGLDKRVKNMENKEN